MRYVTIIFLLLSGAIIPADQARANVSITGQVFDLTTGLPVSQANIHVVGTSHHTTTDTAGAFSIENLIKGEYDIKVSHIAYSAITRHASVGEPAPVRLVVYLEPTTISIKGGRVTAPRLVEDEFSLPNSISITPREEFSERNFSTTAEVMREEPGILVQKTTHGHGAPILRGLLGKHVLLLYDGIRLNKPTFRFGANQYLNTINLESLDRIEVTRGPSSVMYGSDAIGGTINMIPPHPAGSGSRPQVTLSAGSRYSSADNGRSVHSELAGNYRGLAVAAGGTYKKIGDLRAGRDIGRQTPTGWHEIGYFTRVYSDVGSFSRLRFDYLGVRQNEVPRYDKYVCGDFRTYVYNPQDRDLAVLTLDAQLPKFIFHSLKTSISYQREVEGKVQQKTGSAKVTTSKDKISTWGGYLQLSTLVNQRCWLSFGGEYYYDRVNSSRTERTETKVTAVRPTFPDGSEYRSAGLYAQNKYSLTNALTLTLGARYSLVVMESILEEPFGGFDETYRDLTGSLGVNYKLDSTLNLIGHWSRGFRAPNFNDAVVLKYSGSGVDAPSIGLEPEHSNNFEAGVKIQNPRVDGGFFCFYNRLENLIDRVPGVYNGKTFFDENADGVQDSAEYDIFQRRNVDRARIYGFEIESRVQIAARWEARINCFWTWGENQTDHEPLSRIPPLMGMAALRWAPDSRFWFEAYTRLAGDQRRLSARDVDDTRIEEGGTPGWGTLNLRLHFRLLRAVLNLNLENIFDAGYKEHGSGIYSPGRNLLLGLNYGVL